MEKLIELLKQIQELAGVAVDALEGAAKGDHGGPPQGHGGPPEGSPAEERGESPKEAAAEGDKPRRF